MNFRVAILCLFSPEHAEEYLLDYESQRNTWATHDNPNFKVFWIVGDPLAERARVDNSILYVPCNDNDLIQKTISALDYLRKVETFDFYIRSNTSTYFFLSLLGKQIRNLIERNIHFAGFPLGISLRHSQKTGIYCSGAGILFSKEAAEVLLKNKEELRSGPDDVVISHVMTKFYRPYWFYRADLEILPIWWKSSVLRLKNPANSFLTSELMYLVGEFEKANTFRDKLRLYHQVTQTSWNSFRQLKLPTSAYFIRLSVVMKTSVFIMFSRILHRFHF